MAVQLLLLHWMNVATLSVVFVGKDVTGFCLCAELIPPRDDPIHFLLAWHSVELVEWCRVVKKRLGSEERTLTYSGVLNGVDIGRGFFSLIPNTLIKRGLASITITNLVTTVDVYEFLV